VVVVNGIAIGIIGRTPLKNDVTAIGLAAVRRLGWNLRGRRWVRSRPFHPLVRNADFARRGGRAGGDASAPRGIIAGD